MKQNNKHRSVDDEKRSKLDLLNELQIHQAALEKRNQELNDAQQRLEETRDQYADLYDFAPIGYITLDKAGNILSINQTGATILDKQRTHIIGKSLLTCLPQVDTNAFLHYLQKTFDSSGNTAIDLTITDTHGMMKHLRLESSLISDGNSCRMVITDITQLKETSKLNQELLLENRRLLQNLYQIQEKERRTLARELHDELGQWLAAIHAEAEIICNSLDNESVIHENAQSIKECINEMHIIVRSMLHKLCPALLDSLGLPDALLDMKEKWCTCHNDIALDFKLEGKLDEFSECINITVYRIVQEALTNICNHSEATRAKISLRHISDDDSATNYLLLRVQDNGKGYDTAQKSSGLGLLGMRERAIAVGGELRAHSIPNKGTQIEVRLPLNTIGWKRRVEDRY